MTNKRLHTFLDKLRLHVKGGTGGLGLSKYGGIGGRGGNIYVVGSQKINLWRLKKLFPTQRFVAATGENSSGRFLAGKAGADLIIEVPPGISVVTDSGLELGNIDKFGDKILVVKGGAGGGPNNGFLGEKGDHHSISLDLKLIADIGLVGFPNAGKSTLLKALSRASPKIANYPFTTIKPRIGILEYEDHRQISMADLPGLIEGSHLNLGMGHKFLKHVERTKMLLLIVDINGFRLNVNQPVRSALQNILLLNRELELYNDDLLSKPSILVINKLDLPNSKIKINNITEQAANLEDHLEILPEELRPKNIISFKDIVTISARDRINTDYLKTQLRSLIDEFDEKDGDLTTQQEKGCDEKSIQVKLTDQIKMATTEHIGLGGV